MRPRFIRARLTLYYLVVFSVVLSLYIAGASALHHRQQGDQLYRHEVRDLQTVERLLYFTPDGKLLLHDDYHGHPESHLLLDRYMQVMDEHGKVLFRNDRLKGCDLGGAPLPQEFSRGYYARRLRLCDGTPVMSISHLHLFRGRALYERVGYSTGPIHEHLTEFLTALLLAAPLALLIAGLASYHMARQALSPLHTMSRTALRITANRLSERIPVENPDDEVGEMAQVLNGLLGRLELSFQKMSQFSSDVSHELRTPLASLRGVGEVGLEGARSSAEYREIIGSMLEEASRLSSIVDVLLTIARHDAPESGVNTTVFPVQQLVQEAVGIIGVLAEDKSQKIEVAGDAAVRLCADRSLLRMVFTNLLENAVKYSPSGGTIRVSWRARHDRTSGAEVELSVEDEGPGIPEDARERVFDRFYRVDSSRARASGGSGLGLAIAKWAVEAHGGSIRVGAGVAGGARFTVRLPSGPSLTKGAAAEMVEQSR